MNVLNVLLSNRFISITGTDAIKFLQGQTSCDLNALDNHHFSFGTLNSPKGRMYCLYKVLKTEDGLLLSMNESLLDSTLERLSKYAVFFDCELKEESSYHAFGFTCLNSSDYHSLLDSIPLNNSAFSVTSIDSSTFYLNLSQQNRLGEVWIKDNVELPSSLKEASSLDQEDWFALEAISGFPELYKTSQDEFILQSLNLHQLGAVSFKKGCYTGQEIIARMKFLGKQKKQAYLLRSNSKLTQTPLSPVYDSEGKKCGTLIRSHYSENNGSVALAVLPIDLASTDNKVYLTETLDNAFSIDAVNYSEFNK